jgi:16S rRNA A1518/A1519 N6-dimethyltransferase RsmA/KsgA/DIM1 with predicted DNA glycosylase/AP lyase activity
LAETRFHAPYAVIANIPFNRTAALLRRLLFETPAPREAAEKYAGTRVSAMALTVMPWFDIRIEHRFARSDFVPMPGVDTVLLHIAPREPPLLANNERAAWKGFVRHVLSRARPDARGSFRKLLSHLQWRQLCRYLGIVENAGVADQAPIQWIGIYGFFVRHAAPHRRRLATFAGLGR